MGWSFVHVNDDKIDVDADRAGIPVYWIVNLVDRQVEVYSNPRAGRYRDNHLYAPGSGVPVVIAGVEVGRIAVDAILPPARRS